jgi:hypothetical protein
MPKLNTYPVASTYDDALELIGIIPGVGGAFQTVRANKTALVALIQANSSGGTPGADGEDGREVELQAGVTHIQWRYVGDASWIDLVSLASLKGEQGIQGEQGEQGESGTGLTNKGNWAAATYDPGDYVFSMGSLGVVSMWVLNSTVPYASTVAPLSDPTKWIELVAPAGEDGKSVEIQASATHVQWRLVGDPTWINIVALADLEGTPGTEGAPGSPGAAGAKWFTGAGVPDGGTGVNGDFYLRTNGDYYGPKTAGAWGSVVASLKGATGAAGTGVPAGGTTGQVLTKTSGTDFATNWQTPAAGGGGGVDLTTNQSVGGNKTFSGLTSLATALFPNTAIPSPQAGGTYNIGAGMQNVYVRTTGGGALTIKMPDYFNPGAELVVFIDGAASSITWNPGLVGYGTITVKGGPVSSAGTVGTVWRYVLDGANNTFYWLCVGHTN